MAVLPAANDRGLTAVPPSRFAARVSPSALPLAVYAVNGVMPLAMVAREVAHPNEHRQPAEARGLAAGSDPRKDRMAGGPPLDS
jgi:hypothetical protein